MSKVKAKTLVVKSPTLPAKFAVDMERASSNTQRIMIPTALRYMRWCQGHELDYRTATAANGYLDSLAESGKKPGYRKYVHGVVHKLLKAEGLSLEGIKAPPVKAEDWSRPGIPPEIIREMVLKSADKLTPLERAYLALATVYGFRAYELGQISAKNFDWKRNGGTLQVQAAKKGLMRVHLIPDCIKPVLKAIKEPIKTAIYDEWYRIEYKLMGEHINRVGFHSLRRSVDAALLDRLSDTVVKRFFGWRTKETDMAQRYSFVSYVEYGEHHGQEQTAYSRSREVDEQVFAIHPFLRYWEEAAGSG